MYSLPVLAEPEDLPDMLHIPAANIDRVHACLLYTSDAADD